MPELARRILFSVAAIPVVMAVAYLGDPALPLLLALTAGLAAWEFYRIARAAGHEPLAPVGIGLATLLPILVHTYRHGVSPPVFSLATLVVIAIIALAIPLRPPARRPIGAIATTLFGVVYTGGLLSFAYALRYHGYTVGALAGTVLLFFPLLLVWTSDTGGYFVGKAFGRRALAPAVSPGKTVEGAAGALMLAVLVSWAYARWLLVPYAQLGLAPWNALLFGALVSLATQLGDLAESLIKREAGVKDSSRIIPGHGGVLDRVDGLLFALPTAYFLFTLPHFLLPVPR